jgi:hypothetical protein
VAETPIANPTILGVISSREDGTSLAGMFFHSVWKLRFTRALPQTQTACMADNGDAEER